MPSENPETSGVFRFNPFQMTNQYSLSLSLTSSQTHRRGKACHPEKGWCGGGALDGRAGWGSKQGSLAAPLQQTVALSPTKVTSSGVGRSQHAWRHLAALARTSVYAPNNSFSELEKCENIKQIKAIFLSFRSTWFFKITEKNASLWNSTFILQTIND